MSREIKFRVWSNEFDSFLGSYHNQLYLNFETGRFTKDNDRDYILEQYTGLKDKNGKEIFEGDILNICKEEYPLDDDNFKKVGFYNGAFCAENIGVIYHDYLINSVNRPYIVVGNIHENKNLLIQTS